MIINLLGLNSEQFSFNTSLFKEEYLGVLVYLIIAVLLALIIAILSYSLTSQKPESEKLSAYECGFEPYEDTRNKFDIEIVFLLPWSITLSQLNLLGFWSMIDFLLELGIGFIYVWKMQALDW
jgi:NADH:ubiquinone oxidoreductase subunit 3 (subunit A)